MTDSSTVSIPPEDLEARLRRLEIAMGTLLKQVDYISTLTESISSANDHNAHYFVNRLDRLGMQNARTFARQLPHDHKIRDLSDVELQVFSQWGEDGIIEWLVSNLPGIPERFVEFGVENFSEANCHFLLLNRNWKGLIMDGDPNHMQNVMSSMLHWRNDLTVRPLFITAENIDQAIAATFNGEIGILSIDIDGNDYWVWEAIKCVNPAIVIIEYNAVFGDLHPISVPYHPSFTRFDGHPSGLYFGASIAAVRHMGEKRGYEFIGTNSTGVNAFFVRKDLAHHILPLIEHRRAFPSRHRDSRNEQGSLSYTAGLARYELIKHLPVVEVTTGRSLNMQQLGPAFSEEWLAAMS